MGLARRYTEAEVSRILKKSEGQSIQGRGGTGHAEGAHELRPVGSGRAHTTPEGLVDRVLDERREAVGAFDGNQVQAVRFALNSQAGQNALAYLQHPNTTWVFAQIDVSSQNFRYLAVSAQVPAIGPINQPQQTYGIVRFVAMKLMNASGALHIRTAYPLGVAPPGGHSICTVTFSTPGAQVQEMPI